jgi:hypothetical protein
MTIFSLVRRTSTVDEFSMPVLSLVRRLSTVNDPIFDYLGSNIQLVDLFRQIIISEQL